MAIQAPEFNVPLMRPEDVLPVEPRENSGSLFDKMMQLNALRRGGPSLTDERALIGRLLGSAVTSPTLPNSDFGDTPTIPDRQVEAPEVSSILQAMGVS